MSRGVDGERRNAGAEGSALIWLADFNQAATGYSGDIGIDGNTRETALSAFATLAV